MHKMTFSLGCSCCGWAALCPSSLKHRTSPDTIANHTDCKQPQHECKYASAPFALSLHVLFALFVNTLSTLWPHTLCAHSVCTQYTALVSTQSPVNHNDCKQSKYASVAGHLFADTHLQQQSSVSYQLVQKSSSVYVLPSRIRADDTQVKQS